MKSKKTVITIGLQNPLLKSREEEILPLFISNKGVKGSCWFSNLPINISKSVLGKLIPSPYKLLSYIKHKVVYEKEKRSERLLNYDTLSTAKFCPGIRGILNDSLVVTSPVDIHITVFKAGRWIANIPGGEPSPLIEIVVDHTHEQVDTGSQDTNIFDGSTFIKFKLPVYMYSNSNYVMLPPQYHSNHTGLTIRMGSFAAVGQHLPLNIIGTLDTTRKEDYDIIIKKGEALAYLYSTKGVDLKYVSATEEYQPSFGTSFMFTHGYNK